MQESEKSAQQEQKTSTLTPDNIQAHLAAKLELEESVFTNFLKQCQQQMIAGVSHYMGHSVTCNVIQAKELTLFRELEFHIKNNSLTEERLARIFTGLTTLREEVASLNKASKEALATIKN